MSRSQWARATLITLFGVILFPALSSAQSAIAGRVADTSAGVLPGVTVEAASPVLIEKVRSAVTDSTGRYQITNLRPGTYTVTFTLAGFATTRREGVQVPTDVTVSVNIELSVGALEETITVSGATPLVDVRSVARTEVVSRDIIEALPTSRDFKGVGATVPSIKTSRQNVGGTATVIQQGLSSHGLDRVNTTSYVDGMNTNTLWSDGGVQMYQNDAMAQEVAYTTSAVGADNSAGGLRVNVIPREGGNRVSVAVFTSRVPGSWQSENVDQALRDRKLRASDRIEHIFDLSTSVGFPIVQDRLWFYASYRRSTLDNLVANSFHAGGDPVKLAAGIGEQGMNLNSNDTFSGRLTTQLSQRNKATLYFDRVIKRAPVELSAGNDADTSGTFRDPTLYYIGQAKWSSPVTSRLLLEAGYSTPVMVQWKKDIAAVPYTPAWYQGVLKQDLDLGTQWNMKTGGGGCNCNFKYLIMSQASYVTGSHSVKTGVQWGFGRSLSVLAEQNAGLTQRYRNGVPDSVQVFNAPLRADSILDADLGVFFMDSWTLKRLTVSPGLRLEWLKGTIGGTQNAAGRFVPERNFLDQPNMPDWFDVAPRFSMVYDLFGDAKTALKGSVNKYMAQTQTQFQARYNPAVSSSDIRNWTDTNKNDIAEDNEIGASNNRFFGTRQEQNPSPDLRREYNIEYSAGIQQEIFSGVSVTGAWYRRTFHNIRSTTNLALTDADWIPFTVTSPLNGEVFTVYNLSKAKQGLVNLLDSNVTDPNKRSQTYNGFELTANARLPRGASVYGGWTGDRTVAVACDGFDPNTRRFCDERELGLPFRHDFKLAGAYLLPMEVQIGATLQSYAGSTAKGGTGSSATQAGVSDGWLGVTWNVPSSLFPGGRTQTTIVPLISSGTKSLERFTQLDFSISRSVRLGGKTIKGEFDLFNALNSNVVLSQNQTFGANLDQPTEILQGRLLRVAALFTF